VKRPISGITGINACIGWSKVNHGIRDRWRTEVETFGSLLQANQPVAERE
jgi:hypothetical protein